MAIRTPLRTKVAAGHYWIDSYEILREKNSWGEDTVWLVFLDGKRVAIAVSLADAATWVDQRTMTNTYGGTT